MYWVTFFDSSSKTMLDYELNKLSEDEKDSVVEIRDMEEGITLDTQAMLYDKL